MGTNRPIRNGCILKIEKNYFLGNYKKPQFDGKSILKIVVLKNSYGSLKGQHTFTCKVLEVIEKGSKQTHDVNEVFRIKGRNLYPNVIEHIPGEESNNEELK